MIFNDLCNKNMNKQTLVCEKKNSIRQGQYGEKNKHVTCGIFSKLSLISMSDGHFDNGIIDSY